MKTFLEHLLRSLVVSHKTKRISTTATLSRKYDPCYCFRCQANRVYGQKLKIITQYLKCVTQKLITV